MKTFNIMATTFVIGIIGVLLMCRVGELMAGDNAKYLVAPLALLLGLNARRLAEKYWGYTLIEAMKEGRDDESK